MKALKPTKPYMLRRWRIGVPSKYFFTCARPGRTGHAASKNTPVPDSEVHRWVLGLPGPNTAIVSLLGRKPDGKSEFSFYSFYGGFDRRSDRASALSFQEWLTYWHGDRHIVVHEHPTCDFNPIPLEVLDTIASEIANLLSAERTVILIDSGGQTRTAIVCHHMHAVEDSSQQT